MSTVIKLKYSTTTAQPADDVLVQAEAAYSYDSGKLWIGKDVTGTIEAKAIGGTYYTGLMPSSAATHGILTASQAVVVGSDKKINEFLVDDITLDANTISTNTTNTNLVLDPNGIGIISLAANTSITGTLGVSSTSTFTGLSTHAAGIKDSSLTASRITYAGTDGRLVDSANLTYDGTTLTVDGALDVDNILVDGNTISVTDTNGSLVLEANGTGVVDVNATTALLVASGTELQRPVAGNVGNGAIRYNQTANRFEGTVSGSWTGLGGVVDIDQDTYITAEESTDDDTIRIYAAGSQRATINSTAAAFAVNLSTTGTLTADGATTLNGAVNLGNASADAIAVAGTASFTESVALNGGVVVAGSQTISMGSNRVTLVATPTLSTDAATKGYIDGLITTGFDISDGVTSSTISGGDTFTLNDVANETTVTVAGDAVTIGLPSDVTIGNDLTVTNDATITNDLTVSNNLDVTGNTIITGNLTVHGSTVTVNSTTVTIDDPVFTLGGDTAPTTNDGKDKGIEFKWHNGSAAKVGFFGHDESTGKFTFIPDATNTTEVFSGTAGDAVFGEIDATGVNAGNVQVGVTGDNEIDTASGNLTIDSAGGTTTLDDDVDVTGTLDVTGAATAASLTVTNAIAAGSLTLTTDLAVADGGTGLSTFTGKGVFTSNAAGGAIAFVTSSTEGAILQYNASGVPIASNVIDGGTF